MKFKKISRRKFLLAAALLSPLAVYGDARWIEPTRLKIRRLNFSKGKPSHRFVHFTDLHHKGDVAYGKSVVETINSLSPDFVCFTGDLIEEGRYLTEALEILSGVKSPMFGIPGNHDYWSKASFEPIGKCFDATGGAWMVDEQREIADGKLNLMGVAHLGPKHPPPDPKPGMKNLLMIHYPAWANKLGDRRFDLILAGHSHGGQVRIPFYGPIIVPFAVEQYDMGLYRTANGPLYVNPGIGWFPVPLRFNCRPEITVFEM